MSETPQQGEENQDALKQEYLELTRKQSGPTWTEEDRKRLLEVKDRLGMPSPIPTTALKEALHRQGTAGTPPETGGAPRLPLTEEESNLIAQANLSSEETSRNK